VWCRDGVGDGQIQFVYEHELRAMREALKSFGPLAPKLTFIIVSKRINTRSYFLRRYNYFWGIKIKDRFIPDPASASTNLSILTQKIGF
jgi:aubergine-like protein